MLHQVKISLLNLGFFFIKQSLKSFNKYSGELHILQIGANDGETDDFLKTIVRCKKNKSTLVEAVPAVFDRLVSNCKNYPNIRMVNKAVVSTNEPTKEFFYIDLPTGFEAKNDPSLLGSFSRETLAKYAYQEHVVSKELPCININSLMNASTSRQLDIVLTDVEGYDYELIKAIDFNRHSPAIIIFENIHLSLSNMKHLLDLLQKQGYKVFSADKDSYCIHKNSLKYFTVPRILNSLVPKIFISKHFRKYKLKEGNNLG
ncbi:MAG TPA: FkbM family methyltransferase [Phnomibacter sp.]|nr:FkbM family methyltransferase [Phnomibacter sp.]